VAIANDDNPAIAALNVVLGAVGTRGGIVVRSKSGKSQASADADIPSARAVLIDATVPWDFSPPTDAEVFRFAAWDGGSSKADWLLPAPGFLEDLTDVPTAPTSAIETYAVAPGLVKAPLAAQSAAQFLGGRDSTLSATEKVIHARCEEIFRSQSGTVMGQETTSLAKFSSAQKFEEQLWKGAVWVGEPPHAESFHCELKEWPAAVPATHPETWSSRWREPVLPPLASKLYTESTLRETPEKRNV